jgi:hypothetical protein
VEEGYVGKSTAGEARGLPGGASLGSKCGKGAGDVDEAGGFCDVDIKGLGVLEAELIVKLAIVNK